MSFGWSGKELEKFKIKELILKGLGCKSFKKWSTIVTQNWLTNVSQNWHTNVSQNWLTTDTLKSDFTE